MDYQKYVDKVMERLNQRILGKEQQIRLLIIALLSKGHVLLEDVPGVGKTTLAVALAKTMDLSFGRIQFTPDTLPSDITGVSIYHMDSGEFSYRSGPIMNQIILADGRGASERGWDNLSFANAIYGNCHTKPN